MRTGATALVTMALFGLGVWVAAIVLLAYLVGGPDRTALDLAAGPDGTALESRPTTPDKATITRWTGLGWTVVGGGMGFGFLMAVLTRPGPGRESTRWFPPRPPRWPRPPAPPRVRQGPRLVPSRRGSAASQPDG